MVLHGSRISSYFNTPIAIILFFFLVLVGNTLVGVLRRSWMLDRAELGLIYIMWIVAAAIPEWGFTAFLLPYITSVVYYATPENNWTELLLPHVPDWIIPAKDFDLIKGFYEGVPATEGVPWNLWLEPLLFWLGFIVAVYMAMIAIAVILRRQWVERERLVFPVVQLPIAMIGAEEDCPSLIRPFFKSPVMWIGFAVPLVIGSLNGFNHYLPYVPTIDLYGGRLPLFGDVYLPLSLSLQMLGFTYFVNREISFGLSFFFVLNTVEQGLLNVLGVQEFDPVLGAYSAYTGSIVVHQGFGAVIMLVLFGAWTGREHFMNVFRKAFHTDAKVYDGDEILSYRAAVFLLIGSLLFVGVWLWRSGLPAWITPIYLFFAFLLFVAITRVVAEGGLAFIFAPMIASDFVAAGFGTRALGASGIMAFSFTYIWASDILTFVMASASNGLKLAEETIKKGRHLIFWGMLVAIVVTLLSSVWAILDIGYRYGGINTDQFFFNWAARLPFDNAAARMQSLGGPALGKLGLHGDWGRRYGLADVRAASLHLVAVAPARVAHQRGFRDDVPQCLSGLDHQEPGDEVRRPGALHADPALFHGADTRPVSHSRDLVCDRLRIWGKLQRRDAVLSAGLTGVKHLSGLATIVSPVLLMVFVPLR